MLLSFQCVMLGLLGSSVAKLQNESGQEFNPSNIFVCLFLFQLRWSIVGLTDQLIHEKIDR